MLKKLLAVLAMCVATAASAAVDVNTAKGAELTGVKGIGPDTSRLIVKERRKGKFKDWNDFISRVKGVGEKRAAQFSADGLTVNGASFSGAAASPASPAVPATPAGPGTPAAPAKPATPAVKAAPAGKP